jgi:hypothetical protein
LKIRTRSQISVDLSEQVRQHFRLVWIKESKGIWNLFAMDWDVRADQWPAQRFGVLDARAPAFEKRRLNDQRSGAHDRDEISIRNLAKEIDRSCYIFLCGLLEEM